MLIHFSCFSVCNHAQYTQIKQNGNEISIVYGYQSCTTAIVLSIPSTKAIHFNDSSNFGFAFIYLLTEIFAATKRQD